MPFQAVFRKAMVLQEMGRVDESLQVFLHCLALDEDFPSAKRQVKKVRELEEPCCDESLSTVGRERQNTKVLLYWNLAVNQVNYCLFRYTGRTGYHCLKEPRYKSVSRLLD